MVKVKKKKGESTARLVARFRREVAEENIVDNAKEKATFEKPAEKRKKKKYRLERKFERQRSGE